MTPRYTPGKMLQWYSVRLRIYSWFMKHCHPKLASVGIIAGDVGRRQQSSSQRPGFVSPVYLAMLVGGLYRDGTRALLMSTLKILGPGGSGLMLRSLPLS